MKAEKLREEEQAELFNVENVKPLLAQLFSLKSDDVEKRRERVIGLWHALFSSVVSATYGIYLVGKDLSSVDN